MGFWRSNTVSDIADLSGDLPSDRLSGTVPYARIGRKVWRQILGANVDLTYAGAEISGYRKKTGLIEANGLVYFTWAMPCQHKGVSAGSPTFDGGNMAAGTNYAIGLAGHVRYRRALTDEGLSSESFANCPFTTGAGQIVNSAHHYTTLYSPPGAHFAVEAGYHYEFSLWGTAHTDAGTQDGQDGTARIMASGSTARRRSLSSMCLGRPWKVSGPHLSQSLKGLPRGRLGRRRADH